MEPSTGLSLRASIIGAGNVAWGLAPALIRGGDVEIIRVIARTLASAKALANSLGEEVEASDDITLSDRDADMVIIAASDTAIAPIAQASQGSDALWVHTSGSVDMSALAPASPRHGVIYPMQTFTRGVAVDLSASPIYIEASDLATLDVIRQIASTITSRVAEADSRKRRLLHCGAVFACNFANHLWAIADTLARQAGGNFSDYLPLIGETLRKARQIGPEAAQTGPARRGAYGVLKGHEKLLSPPLREIYHLLSNSISSHYEQD
ncbi:MAG: DUF2520 domain-containing protein [Pseudoflavonifractor sp.]|nr:DUF2520 domain-containing protein [Alloprevotella sp.]MCM1116743.1 DUF2520 domain-containing protein [Pseudoflavonifractor sp.]